MKCSLIGLFLLASVLSSKPVFNVSRANLDSTIRSMTLSQWPMPPPIPGCKHHPKRCIN